MRILITGGAGFIGSALIRYLIFNTEHEILNIDKLTYSGNLKSLDEISHNAQYQFQQIDICDFKKIERAFTIFQPELVIHLAAESHVDRSITGAADFIQTNIVGTFTLLQTALNYWQLLPTTKKETFRFHHVSTDEVYGDLKPLDNPFTEKTNYNPSSPYSASKASSDFLVRSWFRTYGLPMVISNCSNNYGPYQHSEKLIPKIIANAIAGCPLPVYGNGQQIRDWLYVEDHVKALYLIAMEGRLGESYNIGASNEQTNITVIEKICAILEQIAPDKPKGISQYHDLISFVQDRPGHDERYAIDSTKICNELNWIAEENFDSGLEKTIQWYLNNRSWLE